MVEEASHQTTCRHYRGVAGDMKRENQIRLVFSSKSRLFPISSPQKYRCYSRKRPKTITDKFTKSLRLVSTNPEQTSKETLGKDEGEESKEKRRIKGGEKPPASAAAEPELGLRPKVSTQGHR
ncbi:hypothetical protein Bca101_066886 [Brassica carinata]